MSEQVVHLLKRQFLGLGKHSPEEKRVGEVADNKEDVISPADSLHGDRSNLSDQGIEGEGRHGGNGDALGTCARVKYFSGDDPTKGTTCGGE